MKKLLSLLAFLTPAVTGLLSQACGDYKFPAEQAGGTQYVLKNDAGNFVLIHNSGSRAFMELSPTGQVLKAVDMMTDGFSNMVQIGDQYVMAGGVSFAGCSDVDVQYSVVSVRCIDKNGGFQWRKDIESYQVYDKARFINLQKSRTDNTFFVATKEGLYHLNVEGNVLVSHQWESLGTEGKICHWEVSEDGANRVFFSLPNSKLMVLSMDNDFNVLSSNIINGLAPGLPVIRAIPGGGWTATYECYSCSPKTCRFFVIDAQAKVQWSDMVAIKDYMHLRALTPVGNEFWLNSVTDDYRPYLYRYDANGNLIHSGLLKPNSGETISGNAIFPIGGNEVLIAGDYRYQEPDGMNFLRGSWLLLFGCQASTAAVEADVLPGLTICPNPATEYCLLETGIDETCRWELLDGSGRLLHQGEVKRSQKIELSPSANGILFLRIIAPGGQITTRKILKQ